MNVPILASPDKIETEVQKILSSRDFTGAADPYACAYRIFVAEEIRKGGGLAIMAHPYWHCYGEYNMQTEDFRYLWKNGCFDALEVLADCDRYNNGSNLQNALWTDMRAEGAVIPIVGASDCRDAKDESSFFNRNFTVVLAKDSDDIKQAIKEERSVAVLRRNENDFFAFGRFRYVKYVRFLLEEYSPAYDKLTKKHAEALRECGNGEGVRTIELRDIEREILEYQTEFFG